MNKEITRQLKGKKNQSDDIIQKIRLKNQPEVDEKYDTVKWLNNVLNKVTPHITTHPRKFTNPKISETSSINFYGAYRCDGYIKTGNISSAYTVDISNNAATNSLIYEYYNLLNTLTDTANANKVIDLFKNDDESLISFLKSNNIDYIDYQKLKDKSIDLFDGDTRESLTTHNLLKQVYFPVMDSYHLLSTTTASMILFEVKNRIDSFSIWIDGKHIRELKKNNQYCDQEFYEIFNLTEIGFSHSEHTKMGTVSHLNVVNHGIAYLLPCIPPKLVKRDIQLPTQDFFKNSLRLSQFKYDFFELHRLMGLYANNMDNRNAITNVLNVIIDKILVCALAIRASTQAGWSEREHYQELPLCQRIWLDDFHSKNRIATDEWATGVGKREGNYEFLREDDDMWLDAIISDCARWIIFAYKSTLKTDQVSLSDDELTHLKTMVEDAILAEKEFFV